MANLEYVNQILSAQRNASEQKVIELKGNILSLLWSPYLLLFTQYFEGVASVYSGNVFRVTTKSI